MTHNPFIRPQRNFLVQLRGCIQKPKHIPQSLRIYTFRQANVTDLPKENRLWLYIHIDHGINAKNASCI